MVFSFEFQVCEKNEKKKTKVIVKATDMILVTVMEELARMY